MHREQDPEFWKKIGFLAATSLAFISGGIFTGLVRSRASFHALEYSSLRSINNAFFKATALTFSVGGVGLLLLGTAMGVSPVSSDPNKRRLHALRKGCQYQLDESKLEELILCR